MHSTTEQVPPGAAFLFFCRRKAATARLPAVHGVTSKFFYEQSLGVFIPPHHELAQSTQPDM